MLSAHLFKAHRSDLQCPQRTNPHKLSPMSGHMFQMQLTLRSSTPFTSFSSAKDSVVLLLFIEALLKPDFHSSLPSLRFSACKIEPPKKTERKKEKIDKQENVRYLYTVQYISKTQGGGAFCLYRKSVMICHGGYQTFVLNMKSKSVILMFLDVTY